MPRPKGTKKGLTDQEKKQILELRNQGLSKDKISMQLHIAAYKVSDYLNEVGDTDQRGVESVDIDMDAFKEKVLAGEKVDALCKVFGISKPTCIKLKKEVISSRDADSISDHDLTIREKDDDNWLVVDVKQALGPNLTSMITFKTHEEITIGGERTVWNRHEDGTLTYDKVETYPTESHIFDIVIPEIKMVIVPVSTQEEMVLWWEEHISKKVDDIFKETDYKDKYHHSFFHKLLVGVSGYEIVFSDDTKYISRQVHAAMMHHNIDHPKQDTQKPFQSCVDCQYRKECSHTYCKARGEEYKPPIDFNALRENRRRIPSGGDGFAGWSKESSEAIQKINEEEYKYWDEKGRIGKPEDHHRPALTNEELKDATGLDRDGDVATMAEIKVKQLTNPRSKDPGKGFVSMDDVRNFLRDN